MQGCCGLGVITSAWPSDLANAGAVSGRYAMWWLFWGTGKTTRGGLRARLSTCSEKCRNAVLQSGLCSHKGIQIPCLGRKCRTNISLSLHPKTDIMTADQPFKRQGPGLLASGRQRALNQDWRWGRWSDRRGELRGVTGQVVERHRRWAGWAHL